MLDNNAGKKYSNSFWLRAMKVICEKYKEEMDSGQAVCKHPTEYCKFRSSCLIHFIEKENKSEVGKNQKNQVDPADDVNF